MSDIDRDGWKRLVGQLDEPAPGAVAEALADARDLDVLAAYDRVEEALAEGVLVEADAGAFGAIHLAGEADENAETAEEEPRGAGSPGDDPEGETGETTPAAVDMWGEVDFSETTPTTWAPEQIERDAWMCRGRTKKPFAPWTDEDARVECNNADCPADWADEPQCGCHAGYKWGSEGSAEHVHADHDTAREWADMDPSLSSDLVYIQREADPFAFVDGDNVIDPETGTPHPAFVAILEHFGVTYADVSTSGTGSHAVFRGEIPLDGVNGPTFEIDTEPWGANDEPPAIEIYDGKHVCVATGDHVAGTGTEIAEWNEDAVVDVLRANGFEETAEPSAERELDLDDYEPTATGSDETTDDIRDVFRALDRLDPKRVGERTIVREWTHGRRSFLPTWGSTADNGTANYIDDQIWDDTGRDGGYGGPAVMAAIDAGLINHAGATPSDVSGETFFKALDHLRDLGFSIPKLDRSANSDAEPVAPLALEKLDALGDGDRERAARKRGAEIPSTREARERLRNAIFRELRAENSTVLNAPTGLGKSYTAATEPWRRRESTTGGAPVIHLHETTDARDDAVRETDASAATGDVLLGRKEASPLARGDHDPVADPDSEAAPDVAVTIDGEPASEWFDRQCEEKGLPFSTALAIARDRNDQGLDELPPFGEEDPAVAQWEGLPRDDDGEPAVDVLHATHEFARVPSLRTYTNVVLDEQPDFTIDVTQDRVRRMITAFLREIDAPVSTFEAFVTLARGTSTGGDAAAERDRVDELLSGDHGVETEWFIADPDAHAIAPGLARAVWNALRWEDANANGRYATKVVHEPPRFDADKDGLAARTILSVVVDEENTVRRIRSTPDFSRARSVIGLDAHPSMPQWELNAAAGMTYDEVLGPEEGRLWRRFERGLTVVQVGGATRPRSGPNATEWMNDDRVRAVLEALREQYGSGFKTALSTAQTEPRLRSLLADVAGGSVDAENTMHFGEEKSRNDFGGEDAGYVYGCMDPGDDMVLDTLAELGLDATPERAETDDGDVVRAKGRGFDGPDADTAAAVLASVRENHVAQAAGRYARNPDDPDSEATVYVHTDAAPEGFVDYETPGVEWLATDLQRDVIDALTERADATAREIAEAVDCSKEHVRETLGRLEEQDLVDREEGAGAYGADVYRDDGAEPREVDLGEIANGRLMDLSRWSLAIDDRHAREDVDAAVGAEPSTADGGVTAGDPPDR